MHSLCGLFPSLFLGSFSLFLSWGTGRGGGSFSVLLFLFRKAPTTSGLALGGLSVALLLPLCAPFPPSRPVSPPSRCLLFMFFPLSDSLFFFSPSSLSIYLSVCLPACLPVCLSVCLSVCLLFVCLLVLLCVLHVCLSVGLFCACPLACSVWSSFCLFVCLFVRTFVLKSVCPFVCLSLSLFSTHCLRVRNVTRRL